ncbi:MAG: hypothetical protein ACE5KD_04510 [Candidatus Bathyarchaeia archaeon]
MFFQSIALWTEFYPSLKQILEDANSNITENAVGFIVFVLYDDGYAERYALSCLTFIF